MIDSDLERRLERMSAGYAQRSVDAQAAWRQFDGLRRRSARNRRLIAVVATATVVVAGAIVGAAFVNHPASSRPTGRSEKPRPDRGGQIKITARIPQPGAGKGPGDTSIAGTMVGENGQIWGITYGNTIFRIDRRTNRVTFSKHIAGLRQIAAGVGAIWALTTAAGPHGQVLRMDPVTGRIVRRFALSRSCDDMSYDTQFWLSCGIGTSEFLRLDPVTGRVIAVAGPAYGVGGIAATPYGIWYVGNSGVSGFIGAGARLRWINVDGLRYPDSLALANSIVYAQGALWALTSDESVAKIDPATGQMLRIYGYQTYDPSYQHGLDFMTVGRGSLWFLDDGSYEATSVLRVSITSGLPQGRVSRVGSCGEPCWQVYLADGSVWVPTRLHITRVDVVSRHPRRRGSR